MTKLVLATAFAVVLGGCLPILPRETVHTPQPAPMCGDTGRPYQAPAAPETRSER